MSYKGQRVSVLPDVVQSGLRYDPETGLFSHVSMVCQSYECRPRDRAPFVLLFVGGYEIAAHRVAFACLDISLGDDVVVHVNGDRMDNRLNNLLRMSKGECMRFRFEQRQAAKKKAAE